MVRRYETQFQCNNISKHRSSENCSDDSDTTDSQTNSPSLIHQRRIWKNNEFKQNIKDAQQAEEEVDDRPILPSGKIVPIPKGKSPYALAKNAEYYDKDNDRAEKLYRQAISIGDRAESSLKDLASLLHRLGKTSEALKLLQENRFLIVEDMRKYENLITTLKNQLNPGGNSLNKCLRISEIDENQDEDFVRSLFQMDKRIKTIEIKKSDGYLSAFVHFNSHSAARKTLQRFQNYKDYFIYWISIEGSVVGNANPSKFKAEQRKFCPVFEYKMFQRNPSDWVMPLAIDESYTTNQNEVSVELDDKLKLIGLELLRELLV